jgi:hypothetical protein
MDMKKLVIVLLFCFSISVLPVIAQIGEAVVAKYGSTPTIDGLVGESEWSDASSISFNGVQVFVKQDSVDLYVGFKAPFLSQSAMFMYFDVNNDNSSILESDDICVGINYNSTLSEFHPASTGLWELASSSGWSASFQEASTTCQAEFRISYAKLGLTAGTDKTLGINFEYVSFDTLEDYFWSFDPNIQQSSLDPSTWGSINSSGYNWIPEFPSLFVLSILMIAVPLVSAIYRKSKKTSFHQANFH